MGTNSKIKKVIITENNGNYLRDMKMAMRITNSIHSKDHIQVKFNS